MYVFSELIYFLAVTHPIIANYILLPVSLLFSDINVFTQAWLVPRYTTLAVKGEHIVPFSLELMAYIYTWVLSSSQLSSLCQIWLFINAGRVLFHKSLPLYTIWSFSGILIHVLSFSWLSLPFTLLRLLSEII